MQIKRLEHIFRELSLAAVLHNDINVGKNVLIDDSTGLFYVIDFGFSKKMKTPNDYENLSLLAHIDKMLVRPVFKDIIASAEKSNGVVIDVRAKIRRDAEERKFKRLAKLVGVVKAAKMLKRKIRKREEEIDVTAAEVSDPPNNDGKGSPMKKKKKKKKKRKKNVRSE